MTTTLPSLTPAESRRGRTGVLLVEDASSTRRLLRAVLESTNTFEVVGEAGSGAQALEATRSVRPDVILLDLSLPDMDGADLLPKLLDIAPAARVVVLSNNARLAGPALIEMGATAFIEKGLAPGELLASLVAALHGGRRRGARRPARGPGRCPSYSGHRAAPSSPTTTLMSAGRSAWSWPNVASGP